MHVSLLLGAFWGVIAYGEQTSCPEPVQKDVRGNESKIGEMRANKCNAQVTGHIQGGGQFRPTKILSSKDELALDGLFFAPEVKEIERHTRLNPRMMAKEAREKIRETARKERTLCLRS
jgi:hypothetical protein